MVGHVGVLLFILIKKDEINLEKFVEIIMTEKTKDTQYRVCFDFKNRKGLVNARPRPIFYCCIDKKNTIKMKYKIFQA